jgi:hypothetical protein
MPGIHVLLSDCCDKDVDGRDKPGHDENLRSFPRKRESRKSNSISVTLRCSSAGRASKGDGPSFEARADALAPQDDGGDGAATAALAARCQSN